MEIMYGMNLTKANGLFLREAENKLLAISLELLAKSNKKYSLPK